MYTFGYVLIAIAIPLSVIGLAIIAKEAHDFIDDLIFTLRD